MKNFTQSGFTLLEVMIAVGILAIGIGAILVAENNSLDVTIRAKRMTTVAMLAKNALIQAEREISGKSFTEVKAEEGAQFDAPFQEYRWERKVKEIVFPNILDQAKEKKDEVSKVDEATMRVVKIATSYLSKATREITVTIKWTEKKEEQKFVVSQYWVDLDHAIDINPTE
jgi:prepilin-type N-terminal cleavage/methylation domain-containing protein